MSKNSSFKIQILEIMIEMRGSTVGGVLFDFTVDYTRTVAEMVQAGKYDRSSNIITSEHYPIPKNKVGKKENIFAKMFCYNRFMSSKDAIREMKKEGFRPATAHEAMAFSEKNPDLQRQYPIIALGSIWRDNYSHNILFLDGNICERKLIFGDWGGGKWAGYCRFLGVRIEKSDTQDGINLINLTVDYAKTIEQAVADGNYDCASKHITTKNFPFAFPLNMIGKKVEVFVNEFHFNRLISSKDAISEMEKKGFRPANIYEIMAFVQDNPKFPVVALGSVCQLHQSLFVPAIFMDGSERNIALYGWSGGWFNYYRFLGVRK